MMHAVEAGFGRKRGQKNAPRTLDLDLIAYGEERRKGEGSGLILPHPGVESRDFVLAPLCDIAPDWVSPVSGQTAVNLLKALPQRTAQRISSEN